MPNRPPQKAVRVGQLERTLEQFNAEMGYKVAESLRRYHEDFIEPRLVKLEAPFWRRWWSVLKKVVAIVDIIRPEKETVTVPYNETVPDEAEPEPPSQIELARPRIIRPDEL